jgi:hypothetical protein
LFDIILDMSSSADWTATSMSSVVGPDAEDAGMVVQVSALPIVDAVVVVVIMAEEILVCCCCVGVATVSLSNPPPPPTI